MTHHPPVTFWAAPPTIDGMLSPEKAGLPARSFVHTFKMAPENPDFALSYRLAYGPGFFYLHIQVNAETLTCRDRGFQNGDGLVLTLAQPQAENAPSPEFYMLGFGPQDAGRGDAGRQPTGRLLWGHNGDFPLKRRCKSWKSFEQLARASAFAPEKAKDMARPIRRQRKSTKSGSKQRLRHSPGFATNARSSVSMHIPMRRKGAAPATVQPA